MAKTSHIGTVYKIQWLSLARVQHVVTSKDQNPGKAVIEIDFQKNAGRMTAEMLKELQITNIQICQTQEYCIV